MKEYGINGITGPSSCSIVTTVTYLICSVSTCFTFGKVDLAPTVEEYTALLRCPKIQVDKAYSRATSVPTLLKKLINITGMSEQWGITPVQAILAETFRSLNACRRAGEGRFIGCEQLLLTWFHSHFWKVPLLEIWGAIGYTPLLVSRLFKSRQFILVTQGLAQSEFSYKGDNCKKKVQEMSNAWNQTRRMKILTMGPSKTPKY
ncbi:hypothetical protein Golob_027782, partial [Gossypium lobatum]|nr:hypothetical protein [Gossypium lobatum]